MKALTHLPEEIIMTTAIFTTPYIRPQQHNSKLNSLLCRARRTQYAIPPIASSSSGISKRKNPHHRAGVLLLTVL